MYLTSKMEKCEEARDLNFAMHQESTHTLYSDVSRSESNRTSELNKR